MTKQRKLIEKKTKTIKHPKKKQGEIQSTDSKLDRSGVSKLQRLVGNRAVQRLIIQPSGEEQFQLDDETTNQINRERGGGQSIDGVMQERMSESLEFDLSDVRVHNSSEADDLNQQLGAKAFTTGQDIFFREGEYDPHSSSGQKLIGHELAHVVQQGTGSVKSGDGMTVNAPGDIFEQEADRVSENLTSSQTTTEVHRQEEEELQMQPLEEEEEMLQPQPIEEEEELLQPQPMEEEEELMMQEEEELMMKKNGDQ